MTREIKRKKEIILTASPNGINNAGNGLEDADSYRIRILKYIPYETVAFYSLITKQIELLNDEAGKTAILWIVFFITLGLTPVYLYFIGEVRKKTQLFLSAFAFCFWSISLGYPYNVNQIQPGLGLIILFVATFAIGWIKPEYDGGE